MSSKQLQSFMIPGGNFGYQGMAIDDLTSLKNCIALTLFDESGSTKSFAREMERAMQKITQFLRKSPEADKIIQAHWQFDDELKEVVGLTPLPQILDDTFDGCWAGGGRTGLYYGECRMLEIMRDYARQQAIKRYRCNGILCTLTDGGNYTIPGDPGHEFTETMVQQGFAQTVTCEDLESIVSVLIGINDDDYVQEMLEKHAETCGYTRYLPVKKADEKTLAKIAGFISQSIQSQSQQVGQGAPSTKISSMTF
jgi:hypothetical protein